MLKYLMLVVFNLHFVVGFLVTYLLKVFVGGPIISIVTGSVAALVVNEFVKWYYLS